MIGEEFETIIRGNAFYLGFMFSLGFLFVQVIGVTILETIKAYITERRNERMMEALKEELKKNGQ